jgi:hypothetical protein
MKAQRDGTDNQRPGDQTMRTLTALLPGTIIQIGKRGPFTVIDSDAYSSEQSKWRRNPSKHTSFFIESRGGIIYVMRGSLEQMEVWPIAQAGAPLLTGSVSLL